MAKFWVTKFWNVALATMLLTSLASGCTYQRDVASTAQPAQGPAQASAQVPVQAPAQGAVSVTILAFNDFHGNLEPPPISIPAPAANGSTVKVPAGGVAYLASAIERERASHANSITVSAGDLIGASPLASSLFLDEPTIEAMNRIGLDFNAVGNHEFDHGTAELLRKQNGGCEQYTRIKPCQIVSPFPGARFQFLAGNSIKPDGNPLFPAYAVKTIGQGNQKVRIGFIGLTLKGTSDLVNQAGLSGLHFADEADTVNALVPKLKQEGVNAIILLIHQGGGTDVGYNDKSCAGFKGDITEVLDRLDPAVDVVVSGHTHRSYICNYARPHSDKPLLLTSAGQYGTLLTRISLSITPKDGRIISKSADNLIVQGEGARGSFVADYPHYSPAPAISALVQKYVEAAHEVSARTLGHISAPLYKALNSDRESPLGQVIADAQAAATAAADRGGSQIAFMNNGGVRADLLPAADGGISFGQIYSVQPFGDRLVTRSFSGQQIKTLLEEQFTLDTPNLLQISSALRYEYDEKRPAGQRVFNVTVNDMPLQMDQTYRVVTSEFLAEGGDGFTGLKVGVDPTEGPQDIEALEEYIRSHPGLPAPSGGRMRRQGRDGS